MESRGQFDSWTDPQGHVIAVTSRDGSGRDHVLETKWDRTDPPRPYYEQLIESCTDPLTFICLHPNAPGELEFIEPTSSYIRTDEYDLFGSDDYRAWLSGRAIRPIGMRELRDRMRNAN